MKTNCILILAVSSLLVAASWAGEFEDRVSVFLVQQTEMQQGMQVYVKRSGVTEAWVAPDKSIGGAVGSLQRLVVTDAGEKIRIDGWDLDDPRKKDAELLFAKTSIYYNALHQPPLARYTLRANVIEYRPWVPRIYPMAAATTTSSDISFGTKMGVFGLPTTTVESDERSADSEAVFVIHDKNGVGGYEVTFCKEPDWAPKKIRFFARGAKQLPKGKITKSDVLGWEQYCTTSTEWKEDEDTGFWLPDRIRIEAKELAITEAFEIRFTGWKFGKDVDIKLVDETHFNATEIERSVNFGLIQQAFDAIEREPNGK
jgi:hypothetical protein